MRAVAPRTGAPEITIAEEQEEYLTITAAQYVHANGDHSLLTRWKPSAEERARIASGADIYVMQLGQQLRPMNVMIGNSPTEGPTGWRIPEDCVGG